MLRDYRLVFGVQLLVWKSIFQNPQFSDARSVCHERLGPTDMGFWWPMPILGSKKILLSDISADNLYVQF